MIEVSQLNKGIFFSEIVLTNSFQAKRFGTLEVKTLLENAGKVGGLNRFLGHENDGLVLISCNSKCIAFIVK